ncbi:unnamed protein product [Macrosiphum euphorbiae]|uniref:Protein phosphatase 1 regulatory subunit 21 C-terminal domain-containing protein n=1 Tax=Macrosiphum euphorbiae TaxID=13131 RepID=A0AAV0WVZ4_9HEMI|nr:unnamed protein product [Macrosiphum euphorbiae]
MSDTDSIKTDKSQSDLQQKYDKLAMEFAKARMQLNVLKKAYTAKTSKLDQRSIESLDQFESCKYDTMSTSSSEIQENFNKTSQVNSKVKGADDFKSKDVQFLRQDINSMHQYIQRVLDSTNSNQLDYNLIMSEIEHCKGIQNSCPNNFCEVLNEELTALKCSVTACLYNILYNKLESRTKISTEDSRLIYPNHYCLDNNYKSDEDRLQKVFVALVLHFFLSFIINLNDVLEDLLKDINPKDAFRVLQKSIKPLTNKLHSNSLVLEKILNYSADLKTFKFDSQHIVMENILLFISNKYIECVNSIKEFIKSDNTVNIDCSALRQNIISFMALKFPIGELVNSGEYLDSTNITKKLDGAYDTVHTLLRAINILEFEYLYKYSQVDMHWHMRNPLLHVKHSKQAKEELNSASISQNSYKSIIHVYNEKLNEEMNRSLSLEQEKIHWENEYKLLCKNKESIPYKDKYSASLGAFSVENELGKCESGFQFNDGVMEREKELKCYFEKKINNLISTNKELSSQSNAYAMEITALKTRLDHSIFVRNDLEIKLHEASEHIDDLKEEFHLTSTNYESQLRAMTEHLASLNETVVLERRHIDDLNSQLKMKAGKKKSSK